MSLDLITSRLEIWMSRSLEVGVSVSSQSRAHPWENPKSMQWTQVCPRNSHCNGMCLLEYLHVNKWHFLTALSTNKAIFIIHLLFREWFLSHCHLCFHWCCDCCKTFCWLFKDGCFCLCPTDICFSVISVHWCLYISVIVYMKSVTRSVTV